jgi:hypothetical protein
LAEITSAATGPEIAERSQFANRRAMTSYRQIEANRRNALKSTGPKTEAGKQASRRNAVRHGLTAETVIGALEDAEDYKGFEAAITADYDAQSAVERELVLRLASVLWRLRRATTMETGLFEIQAEQLRSYRQNKLVSHSQGVIHAPFEPAESDDPHLQVAAQDQMITIPENGVTSGDSAIEFAGCLLRLANLPNFALDRLSRYEATLWRQTDRILFALEALDRRKPQERGRSFGLRSKFDETSVEFSPRRAGLLLAARDCQRVHEPLMQLASLAGRSRFHLQERVSMAIAVHRRLFPTCQRALQIDPHHDQSIFYCVLATGQPSPSPNG